MNRMLALLGMCCLLAAGTAGAEEMLFVTGGMSPPLVYEEDGNLKGTDLDVLAAFCESRGIRPVFRAYPLKRAMAMTQENQAQGVFSVMKSSEREAFLVYPATPVNIVKTTVWTRKGTGIAIQSLKDLAGRKVGVILGYKYGPEFDAMSDVDKITVDAKDKLITLLAAGRLDLTLDSEQCFQFTRAKMGLKAEDFEPVYLISENPVYVAFTRAAGPRAEQLAGEFDRFMAEITANGRLETIRAKYR